MTTFTLITCQTLSPNTITLGGLELQRMNFGGGGEWGTIHSILSAEKNPPLEGMFHIHSGVLL